MTVTIDDIIKQVKSYNPASNSDRIREAYELAEAAHKDQRRDSGV